MLSNPFIAFVVNFSLIIQIQTSFSLWIRLSFSFKFHSRGRSRTKLLFYGILVNPCFINYFFGTKTTYQEFMNFLIILLSKITLIIAHTIHLSTNMNIRKEKLTVRRTHSTTDTHPCICGKPFPCYFTIHSSSSESGASEIDYKDSHQNASYID